jgi:trimeric autotransporter adhesin
VGRLALSSNTTACLNTAVGNTALMCNTTGTNNTAVGNAALDANTTACNNTAVGMAALAVNTTGCQNTAVGSLALDANTTGNDNVAMGFCSLTTNTTASSNVAIGTNSMRNTTTGDINVAIGASALLLNTDGDSNVAVGHGALADSTTGECNVAIGRNSLDQLTTGTENTAVGFQAGAWLAVLNSGSHNTYIGAYSSPSGISATCELIVNAGEGVTGKGNNTGFINGGGGGVYQGNNSSSWSTVSDQRIKKNITDNNIGLEKINQIQIKNFEYRTLEEITDFENPKSAFVDKQGIQLGVIAQEIEEILPDVVKEQSTGVKSVNPDNITWYMINAIKELKAEIDLLKNK